MSRCARSVLIQRQALLPEEQEAYNAIAAEKTTESAAEREPESVAINGGW